MIPLIIFVFGEFCIFNGRRVDVVAKPPWFHLFFFAVNLAALDGAIPKLHVKNLPEKICRWEGAIPILPAVARPHPKTADEACNLDWGPLECRCVASSGTVFGALWFCPAPEHFYSRSPSSKTSLARQGCSISMWTCSEFLSLRTRFYRRAGPVVFYSHQSCLPYGGPLCENLTLHNGNFKKNNPNLFYYSE